MTFHDLHERFVAVLRNRIRNGDLTERSLARLVGVSQPHLHHVLHGKRAFSVEMADFVMSQLHMDVLDLIQPEELAPMRDGT